MRERETVVVHESQTLPALVNVLLPGVGQLIQGRFAAWLGWWIVLFVSGLLILAGIGLVTTPILWILCILDAAKYRPKRRA